MASLAGCFTECYAITASTVALRNGVVVLQSTHYFVQVTCLYSSVETPLGRFCDHGLDSREMSYASARS